MKNIEVLKFPQKKNTRRIDFRKYFETVDSHIYRNDIFQKYPNEFLDVLRCPGVSKDK